MPKVIEIKRKNGKPTIIGYNKEIYVMQSRDQLGAMKLTMEQHRKLQAEDDKEPMGFAEYQALAQRTADQNKGSYFRSTIAGLGIAGEAGEVADLLKKHIGHGHALEREKLKKELGDVLWYIAEIAWIYGIPLQEIAEVNIQKLRERYPDGFSEERSRNRVDD